METNSTSTSSTKTKRPFWKLSKKEKIVALVVMATLMVGVTLPSRIIVATSDSLDHRVFFKVPVNPRTIEMGEYLLFELEGEIHKPYIRKGIKENNLLIKKVGCGPGMDLSKDTDGTFFCNQVPIGKALVKDSQGLELPVFTFSGEIPRDSYYMMGANPRSFDSRYFGLIHGDAFISKALPLW